MRRTTLSRQHCLAVAKNLIIGREATRSSVTPAWYAASPATILRLVTCLAVADRGSRGIIHEPMILEHPGLDAFEPLLRKLHTFGFTGGIETLASRGLTMADIERDQAAHSRFIRGCHQGDDRAQRDIARALIEWEQARRAAAALVNQRRQGSGHGDS